MNQNPSRLAMAYFIEDLRYLSVKSGLHVALATFFQETWRTNAHYSCFAHFTPVPDKPLV